MSYGNNNLTAKKILTDPVLFLAFGFGSGLAKKAPGTLGTLAAIPVYILISQFNFWVYSLLTLLVIVSGIWICQYAADKLGVHDFGGIVWDEVAGFLVTMWIIPFSWKAVAIGFILFRIFDIFKPWPIGLIDRQLKGGMGIMMDDVLAGVYALGVLLVIDKLGLV